MRVVVTGGAGFIGSHVAEAYASVAEVVVLDDLRTGYRRNLAGVRCEFVEGSILDPASVAAAVKGAEIVFHFAAMVSVPESVVDPKGCVDLNVHGALNVLEASAAAGVRKLVFASSAAVYGDNPEVPKVETMRPEPKSPYAVTKLDGEFYCDLYRRERGLETACLRFFNVFGPRQDPKGAYAAAVPIFIARGLAGAPLEIHGDGGQTRDFIHVADIVSACRFLAGSPGLTGVYNAGYGGATTVLELAQAVVAATGGRSEIRFGPERAGDVRHSRASVEKLVAAGWRPEGDLRRGLEGTVAWYADRPARTERG
jgi:UDP-glucose 4-epimerase